MTLNNKFETNLITKSRLCPRPYSIVDSINLIADSVLIFRDNFEPTKSFDYFNTYCDENVNL